MWKYAVVISYIGTDYCGWQKQKAMLQTTSDELTPKPSIGSTIETALEKITGEKISVVGSGRTDAGVHAVGQVAHFILKKKHWDPLILFRALNSTLPRSIKILKLKPVSLDFHAQKSAQQKQYSYYFQQGPCPLPFLEPYSWWIHKSLDQQAMQKGLSYLIGEHDFKPFQASGSKPGPTVRRILEAQITFENVTFPGQVLDQNFGLIRVRIIGTGFLKQMVRGIAGTLLQVGEGRRSPECFKEILESLDRKKVGPTAPARALWLERVWYGDYF